MSIIPILKLKSGATYRTADDNTTIKQGEPASDPSHISLFITGFKADEKNNLTFDYSIYSQPENRYNAYSPIYQSSIFVPAIVVAQVANIQTDGSIVYIPDVIRQLLYEYLLNIPQFSDWELTMFSEPEPPEPEPFVIEPTPIMP